MKTKTRKPPARQDLQRLIKHSEEFDRSCEP
ncbi:hypothetical protein D918_07324 [Trichuris suis]|nr:hypothetical protein D918_07324 [Trichuris suis]